MKNNTDIHDDKTACFDLNCPKCYPKGKAHYITMKDYPNNADLTDGK